MGAIETPSAGFGSAGPAGATPARAPLRRVSAALFRVLLGAGALACSDAAGPADEQPLASGFRILAEGAEVASASGPTAVGRLQVAAGGESPLLEVVFLDAGGEAVTPGPGLGLDARVHVTEVATLQVVSSTGFTARLRGGAPGATTARFTLLERGAAVYVSPPVNVQVDAGGP